MATYIIQDRQTGTLIDEFGTWIEAKEALEHYENIDMEEGNYEPDFYEIVKMEK